MIRICLHPDARAFLARAEPWLKSAEIEHSVALQSARYARTEGWRFEQPLYWATVEDGSQIVGCAFRTPPYRLGITALPLDAIPKLVESVAATYRTVAGVAGPEPAAKAFTAAWLEQRGGSAFVRARQRLLEHKALVPMTRAVRGTLRLAAAADAGTAQQWGTAFARESGLTMLDGSVCARMISDRRLYFWDDGEPRCMLGVLRETNDAAAIGILYTPPSLRERGYATASVVAFSQQLLERGLKRSYVCIDPADAAAYSVCSKLGFGVVQDTVDIDYDRA
jgi:hypothetical protein